MTLSRPRRSRRCWFAALIGASLAACGAHHRTQRVFDGRTVEGHYIEPTAYAAYAEGSFLEARGELDAAERAYQRALHEDPHGAPIWTRLGALRCRRSLDAALDAFERAAEEDPAAGWTERARCLAHHHDAERALVAAARAVAVDAESSEANLLYADLLIRGGERDRASAWLFAWLCFAPDAAPHWKAVEDRSKQLGDAVLARLARERANPWHSNADTERASGTVEAGAVSTALLDADIETARARASAAGWSPSRFALAALESGRAEVALVEAETVLAADPTNGDALATALFAAAALGDTQRFQRLLHGAEPGTLEGPSDRAASLLKNLIAWFVDSGAADAWWTAQAAARPPSDR